jgi:predicted Zn-dependent protease
MEADRIGLILASEACFDPHAAARVFARMKEDEENYNNNNDNQVDNHRRKTSPPEWMSTHPGYDTRLSLFNIGDGSKCQSIREEMKRARVLAAAMHDGNEGRRRFQ